MRGALGIAVLVATCGCVTFSDRNSDRDTRVVTILSLDLMNQHTLEPRTRESWRGDWIFRRDRLMLLDQELRSLRPDLAILQGVMARRDSPTESDLRILQAGALRGYDFRGDVAGEYEDTDEEVIMAVGTDLPVKVVPRAAGSESIWRVGGEGLVQAVAVQIDDQLALVLNVQSPQAGDRSEVWHTLVEQRATEQLALYGLCGKRLIVAGNMPRGVDTRLQDQFFKKFELKDTGDGFCERASACATLVSENDLVITTQGDQPARQADRIWVHQDTAVISGRRALGTSSGGSDIRYEKYGVQKLTPTLTLGWLAQVRLARCP